MTDTYLRSLGFAPSQQEPGSGKLSFDHSWRYQHESVAQDGTPLYIEHPLGIDGCRVSNLVAPLAAQDVFAQMPLHDRPALEAAVISFFAAHGGKGAMAAPFVADTFRPFRRAI